MNPIPWYIEDPISNYIRFFFIPANKNIYPKSCSLVNTIDGSTYPAASYTFAVPTFKFATYSNYWSSHMSDSV